MDRYEYEDLDQYEDDFIEDDDAIEQEEPHKYSKEELDYLELRQQLKEQRIKELKKGNGTTNESSREKKSLGPRDGFGSFFGPSQPVIAQRVIQESKALLETVSSSRRVNKSCQSERKSSGPSLSGAKSQSSGQKPFARNGSLPAKKLEIIKNTRDYSFLLNDDAELPAPKKVPPPRNISAPRPPEARSSQPSDRSVSNGVRRDGNREDHRSSTPSSNRLVPRGGIQRPNQPRPSMDSKKQLSGRPSVDARKHINGRSDDRPSVDDRKHLNGRSDDRPSVNVRKHINGRSDDRPSLRHDGASNGVSADRRKQLSGSGLRHDNASNGVPADRRKQLSGSGPGRPVAPPSRPSSSVIVARPSSSKPNPGVSRQPNPPVSRHPNPNVSRQPAQAGKPKQSIRPRKRPSEEDEALMELRKLTGYNPHKYQDQYDSDSDMEAGFDDIQKEERRSALYGKKEDEEELQKEIEEQRRRAAKKRRLAH